jgi:hypothetical protein
MKKLWMKLLTCSLFLLTIPIAIFSQTTEETKPIADFISVYVANFAGFCAVIILVTSMANKLIKVKESSKQYLSWAVSLIIGFAAFFLKLGIFANIEWYIVIVYSFLFAVGSNGLFDWDLIRKILVALKLESTVPATED